MDWKKEWKSLAAIGVVFAVCFYLPLEWARFGGAVMEALYLVRAYAREHALMSLVPAFFIAGAIGVFIKKKAIIQYLGPRANPFLAYGIASVSGTILSVCSCTVLPLFSSIYRMGAGLGPAVAFLYSGPAINVLAIILTLRVLGWQIGVARALGVILFSVVIGMMMQFIFKNETRANDCESFFDETDDAAMPLWKTATHFGLLVAILVFANLSPPAAPEGFWAMIVGMKWWFTGIAAAGLGATMIVWMGVSVWKMALWATAIIASALAVPQHLTVAFSVGVLGLGIVTSTSSGNAGEWFKETWKFVKQILPPLLVGILLAGLLLGRAGNQGLIPSAWIQNSVGGNSLAANFISAVVSALMYFCTLMEVPLVQGLLNNGMGKGPALALLLAGPALSLPNMIVLTQIMGVKKTTVYISLVVVLATLCGWAFGVMVS